MLRLSVIAAPALLIVCALLQNAAAEEMSCCSAAAGPCRSVCSKMTLISLAANSYARENATRIFSEFCSTDLEEFWKCINGTFKEIERNENWSGRGCCRHAKNPACRAGCATAGATRDLKPACRWSDEPELADCIERREEADECCSSVANSTCRAICRELFHSRPAKQSALKQYSSRGCFHQVPKCLKGAGEAKVTEDPKLYSHCCEQSAPPHCLETCRRSIHTSSSIHDVLDALEEPCGPVQPHSPLWSCFLKTSPIKAQRLPLNVGKLACCSRAARKTCLNLCNRAFQTDWAAWQQLETSCLSSYLENDLRRCLEETEDTCEMGCSGLSFCSKFNDRPTTLFRSCNTVSDDLAKWEADHWIRGGVISGLGVPVRVSSNCPIETLRAAACLLQLRPCESRLHETRLCREDCLDLMTRCVDWSAVKHQTATSLCVKLAPLKNDMPCVSIKPFLEDPREHNEPPLTIEEDINMPCRNNPCPQAHICEVRSDERSGYRCVPACPLGEMSKQLIPLNGWAQVPRHEHQSCYRICQCTNSGSLDKCRDLACHAAPTSCWVQNSFVAHRSNFYLECNACRCFEGEVTCSRKSCAELKMPALPCDCLAHYTPVCGKNGVTYPNTCLAKCSGMMLPSELAFNSCSSKDPCGARPCAPGERCVRRSRVCLIAMPKACEQFECVPSKCEHRLDSKGPVCDTDNRQHSSLCSLIRSGASLAYRGPCLRGCSLRGPVCAVNGETYASECVAWAERTLVDYHGHCAAVGLVGEQAKPRCGDSFECPPLVRSRCLGVTPPGACCPVCGGAARLFYSRKQLERIYYQLNDEADKHIVTLEAMLAALSRQLQVSECSLRGMMTPEGDIFVINQPTARRPSDLQMAACVAEMEKLVSRIAERSPRIVTEIPLSALTWAEVAHVRVSCNSADGLLVARIGVVVIGLIIARCWT